MQPFHVVMADPDPLLVSACRLFLVGQDVELVTATTARQARDCVARDRPDLLVLDPELPEIQVEDFLPDGENGSGSPLLILTANPEALRESVLRHPGVALMLKPASPALVALLIESFSRSSRPVCAVVPG